MPVDLLLYNTIQYKEESKFFHLYYFSVVTSLFENFYVTGTLHVCYRHYSQSMVPARHLPVRKRTHGAECPQNDCSKKRHQRKIVVSIKQWRIWKRKRYLLFLLHVFSPIACVSIVPRLWIALYISFIFVVFLLRPSCWLGFLQSCLQVSSLVHKCSPFEAAGNGLWWTTKQRNYVILKYV
jgi:hypothetical protein